MPHSFNFFEPDRPTAWVVGEGSELKSQACVALQNMNLRVVDIGDISNVPPTLARPSYIFCFAFSHDPSLSVLEDVGRDARALLAMAARANAKFLLVGRDNVPFRVARKLVSASALNKRIAILNETPDAQFEMRDSVKGMFEAMFAEGTRDKVFSLKALPFKLTPLKKGKNKGVPKKVRGPLLAFFFITLFLLLPFLILGMGGGFLALSVAQAKSGDFAASQNFAGVSGALFDTSHRIFRRVASIPVVDNLYAAPTDVSYLGTLAGTTLVQASNLGKDGREVISGVFGSNPVSLRSIVKLSKGLEELAVSVGFLEAHAKGKQIPGIPEDIFSAPSLFELSRLAKVAPGLLGMEGKQKYLVLFQNNMELRPTGGFIGSFGLLTFEDGRLLDIEVKDVYDADGQLKGHVEPPEKLREHLGEANWYLRDSNWSPDFPTTATRAEWFLDKELGADAGRVDGVIAVDLEFAKKLLGIVGEIEVQDFGERVNAQNFYEITQRRAEVGFFPGSSQKADFLTAINNTLVKEISSRAATDSIAFARTLLASLEEKHVLLYLHNEEAQSAVKALGWDGGIENSKCKVESSKCREDYLMVVDANVGVNKTNYFMRRSAVMDVAINKFVSDEIAESAISHKLLLSYSNRSRQDRDRYKNYLRIYVPSASTNVTANLVNSHTGEKKPLILDSSRERGRNAYGALLEVLPNSSSQVVFSWDTPIMDKEVNSLSFVWQKQSGTIGDSVVLRFKGLEETRVDLSPKPNLTGRSGLGYTTVLDKDLEVNIKWID